MTPNDPIWLVWNSDKKEWVAANGKDTTVYADAARRFGRVEALGFAIQHNYSRVIAPEAASHLVDLEARKAKLEYALELAATRLEILTGRMRACHAETGRHQLLDEAELFSAEAKAALGDRFIDGEFVQSPVIAPIHTEFGREADSWNIDDETGPAVGIDLLGSALGVWSFLQDRDITVREAASAFRCTDQMIQQAVQNDYWMYLDGPDDDPTQQTIQHEGE